MLLGSSYIKINPHQVYTLMQGARPSKRGHVVNLSALSIMNHSNDDLKFCVAISWPDHSVQAILKSSVP